MRKAQQEANDTGDEDEGNSAEDAGSYGRGDGEEGETDDGGGDEDADDGDEADDGDDADGEGEADEGSFDDEHGNAEDEGNSEGDPDEQGDGRQDERQQGSKVDRHNVKKRKKDNNSDDSGSSGDHSKSSFDRSRKDNMKALQSTVRDKELPLRVAYEQLDELAANAELVRSAIAKNRTILDVQVKKSNSRYLRAAFAAWKLDLDWQKAKRRDINRANAWRRKSLMLRAFRAWGKDHLVHVKSKRLQKSAVVIIQRHNMRRCWKAWIALIKEKLRDQEEYRKEKRLVKEMDYKHQEKIFRRACNFMYRYRLRRIFLAFRDGCKVSRLQDQWENGIERHLARRKLKRLFQGWRIVTAASNFVQGFLQARLRKRNLRQFFKVWKSEVGEMRSRAENLEGLSLKSSTNKLAVAFSSWASLILGKKANGEKLRNFIQSAQLKMMKNAFGAFVDGCSESKCQSKITKRIFKRMRTWRLNKTFQAWICFMQNQAQKKMARLQEHVVTVEKDNDRLRVENERLGHVIDSGNWGKDRITELVQAGQVLTGERDALTRLLGRMQRQHSFALDQQRKHEEEAQELKRELMGKKHLVRNKLLVKGASSFNSLIKAMREDVLKNGNDQELLYTIDKLAMDEVTVFPDGDLSVKHMTKFERGKGNWSHDTRPGSNSDARLSPQPIHPAPTTPVRSSTTPTKAFRARTPVKARTSDKDISTSQSSLALSSKTTPGTPRHVRPKTPMRGRAINHFDYAQNTRSSDQAVPLGTQSVDREVTVKGPHRDLGVIKKYPYQPPSTPTS